MSDLASFPSAFSKLKKLQSLYFPYLPIIHNVFKCRNLKYGKIETIPESISSDLPALTYLFVFLFVLFLFLFEIFFIFITQRS